MPNRASKRVSRNRGAAVPTRRPRKSKNGPNVVPRQSEKSASLSYLQERWSPVFPSRTTRKLRYATSVSISAGATPGTHVFSANGLFDPDITGTGHQPMGFDQLMLSYNHYHVLNASINVLFRNLAGVPLNIAIRVDPDATPVTSPSSIMEYGLLNADVCDTQNVSGSVRRLTESVSIRRIQGVDDVLDVTELGGSAAANPSEQTYFHVLAWDPQAIGGNMYFDVVITYTAVFTEPRNLTPSQVVALQRALEIPIRFPLRTGVDVKCCR